MTPLAKGPVLSDTVGKGKSVVSMGGHLSQPSFTLSRLLAAAGVQDGSMGIDNAGLGDGGVLSTSRGVMDIHGDVKHSGNDPDHGHVVTNQLKNA